MRFLNSLLAIAVLSHLWSCNSVLAQTIGFDNYVSPTSNDLANKFNQTGIIITPPYTQATAGGVFGGSVLSYSGSEYRATAVFNQNTFDISAPGSSVALSMDLYYNAHLQPLAPSANAVRSFRLGLLNSVDSAFETFGNASAYIEGDYSLTSNQMNSYCS